MYNKLNIHMHIALLSRARFFHTYSWALMLSILIVGIAATLARATLNVSGALVRKPDIAVLLLLPKEGIWDSTLLRSLDNERDYLLETRTGPKLARLMRGRTEWYVQEVVPLREDRETDAAMQE